MDPELSTGVSDSTPPDGITNWRDVNPDCGFIFNFSNFTRRCYNDTVGDDLLVVNWFALLHLPVAFSGIAGI